VALLALTAARAAAESASAVMVGVGSPDAWELRVLARTAEAAGRAPLTVDGLDAGGAVGGIALLAIEGAADTAGAAEQFRRWEDRIIEGGYAVFSGCGGAGPGALALVGEALRSGRYEQSALIGSLVVLRKRVLPGKPLVSCIMPTYNRRAFVPRAIRAFLRQDYPRCELIVVDDGPESVADLIPDDPRIRYVRVSGRRTIGAKRNLACERAHGELIVHWDDDDWSARHRLSYQVEMFLQQDVDVSGLQAIFFCDPSTARAWRYEYPAERRPWVHDATFCYRRSFWAAHPFPDTSYGIDTTYLWQGAPMRVGSLPDPSFYVGLVHEANTSRKDTRDAWWHPLPVAEIASLMGSDWAVFAGD
jgi:hypothetical protein